MLCPDLVVCDDSAVNMNRGELMTAEHRGRLRAAGVEAESLDATEWRAVTDPLPEWWHEDGNVLYFAEEADLASEIIETLTMIPVRNVLIAIGSEMHLFRSLLIGGDDAIVFIDQNVKLTAGEVYCGAESTVVLHGPVTATRCAVIDARNGGSIVAAPDQLWAANVYVATDDMHRLEDRATGERINPFGAHIRIGRHVWLGRDAVITGHCDVGDGVVVAQLSMVRGQKIADHAAVAGIPARVVRENVGWTEADTP